MRGLSLQKETKELLKSIFEDLGQIVSTLLKMKALIGITINDE